jgi:hypothetical protein
MNEVAKSEPSIGALLGSLVSETGTLVRQEIHLASTEMGQKAKSAVVDLKFVAMGGALAHAGLLCLIAGVILGLGTIVPMWISAIVIGLGVTGGGYALLRTGVKALRELDPVPKRTVQTLQQYKAQMKEQTQ